MSNWAGRSNSRRCVGSVIELGRITETPTPNIDAVYALTSLLAKNLQQHKATLRLT